MLVILAVSQFMESILFIYLDKYTEEHKDKELDRVSSWYSIFSEHSKNIV